MIEIIRRGNPNNYKVTCTKCGTEFAFNKEQDTHLVCYGQGNYVDTVYCPVCGEGLANAYDSHFIKI